MSVNDNDLSLDAPSAAGALSLSVQRWQNGQWQTPVRDHVAQEVAIAVVLNGISHTVMMATPGSFEDFALGFAYSEGLIDHPGQLYGVDVQVQDRGIELHLEVAAEIEWRVRERRRSLAGRTGCGLCGAESLTQVQRSLAPVASVGLPASVLVRAHEQLQQQQTLQAITGATHAAAWVNGRGDIACLREDVGRHNALDKLIGAMLRQQISANAGAVLITSRASFEMVQKTVALGAGVLAAVSAPTALAVQTAQAANLCLAGFVRPHQLVAYSFPERLQEN